MQETIIKQLSSNEEETRNESFQKFINMLYDEQNNIKYQDWIGIFYFIYHLDNKLLEQQRTLNILAKAFTDINFDKMLIHFNYFVSIIDEKFESICNNRLNKYLFIIKKVMIGVYLNLHSNLNKNNIIEVNEIICKIFLKFDKGISMELIENFSEIINNFNTIGTNTLFLLFKPIMDCLSNTYDKPLKNKIKDCFYDKIIESIFFKLNSKDKNKKFINYFYKYSINPNINFSNRQVLYEILQRFKDCDEVFEVENLEENDENIMDLVENDEIENMNKDEYDNYKDTFDDYLENENKKDELINNNKEIEKELINENDEKLMNEEIEVELMNEENDEESINKKEDEESINEEDDEESINEENDEESINEENDEELINEQNDEELINEENENLDDENNFTFNFEDYNIPNEEDYNSLEDLLNLVKKYCPEKYEDAQNKLKDFELMEEDLSGDFDPYSEMTMEEMQEKLPKYYFLTPKQKKKFFKKLSNSFKSSLKTRKIQKKERISFKMSDIVIKKFNKNKIIDQISLSSKKIKKNK